MPQCCLIDMRLLAGVEEVEEVAGVEGVAGAQE
jgi:hypothetical protein